MTVPGSGGWGRAALLAVGIGSGGCGSVIAHFEGIHVQGGLRALAAERGVDFSPRGCTQVDGTRVTVCEAPLSVEQLARLREGLMLGPLGETPAPGPPFGRSRCLDQASPDALRLVTAFPWIAQSHYRYLLVVVPPAGGVACVETEEGYG